MNRSILAQFGNDLQYTPSMIGAFVRPKGMGMDTRTLEQHAHDLVCNYCEFDANLGQYDLTIRELPDFVLHEFAAHIMAVEPDYAYEANGADNPAFTKIMLPALVKFLTDTTDKDLEIAFVSAWRDGVTSYMTNRMQELLSDALCEYNSEEGFAYSASNELPRLSI